MIRAAPSPRPGGALRAIGTVRHFAAQQTIFAEGEPAAHFMLIIHGMVRSCSAFADGRRFIGAFYAAGEIFGLERNAAYLASAEAVCETAIVLYPAPDWSDVTSPHDNLSRQIFSAMMISSDQARCHAKMLGRLRAIEKMATFLLECHDRNNQCTQLTLEMTRQDIADYLGLTVETVSRCLAQLKRQALISLQTSRHLRLLDVVALQAISG